MKATLILGNTTVRGVRAIFGPNGAHDRMGPSGKLFVPVYLKAIFGRDLVATLEADGVGAFAVRIGGGAYCDGGEANGSFEVLRPPAGWTPPKDWPVS
jgi:hypothetical protein